MTEEEREQLKSELDCLKEAEKALIEARKPFDLAINAIAEVRFNLLERHEVNGDDYDTCETCDMPIFTGEPIFTYSDDGPSFCGEHAPTRAECKSNLEDCLNTDNYDASEIAEIKEAIARHEQYVADGGSWDDKVTWTR